MGLLSPSLVIRRRYRLEKPKRTCSYVELKAQKIQEVQKYENGLDNLRLATDCDLTRMRPP